MGVSLWEALFVVSQKWSFPTALLYYAAEVNIRKHDSSRIPLDLFLDLPRFCHGKLAEETRSRKGFGWHS